MTRKSSATSRLGWRKTICLPALRALFVGDIEVCTDMETKSFLWREGFEMYYPKGVTDPDYCVLKLTVKKGSHYHGLCNTKFLPEEME